MGLMKYFTPFRSATYLLILYCVAHTAGGMLAQESLGPQADAVFALMKSVRFDFNGATSTWYGFWFGFGMMVSVFLLLLALIAWQLGEVPPTAWPAVSAIAWALAAAHAVTAVLSWKYFFLGPALFGVAISTLLAYGAYSLTGRSRSGPLTTGRNRRLLALLLLRRNGVGCNHLTD